MKKIRVVSKTNPFSSNPADYLEYEFCHLGNTVFINYIKPFFNIKQK